MNAVSGHETRSRSPPVLVGLVETLPSVSRGPAEPETVTLSQVPLDSSSWSAVSEMMISIDPPPQMIRSAPASPGCAVLMLSTPPPPLIRFRTAAVATIVSLPPDPNTISMSTPTLSADPLGPSFGWPSRVIDTRTSCRS